MDLTTCPLTSFSSKNGPQRVEDIVILEAVAAFMYFSEEQAIEKGYMKLFVMKIVEYCYDQSLKFD
jgi:hypothetical protein